MSHDVQKSTSGSDVNTTHPTDNAWPHLTGQAPHASAEEVRGNIENYIGMAQVPVGLTGPLLVHGKYTQGEFKIPLATTEGALVASYSRGIKAASLSGGVTSRCLKEGLQRSPFFGMDTILDAETFSDWAVEQLPTFQQITSESSRFAKLRLVRPNIEGNSVILTFEFSTADAAGQNMVTICTDRISKWILNNAPVKVHTWYIESNYSGDKKATALSFTNGRGRKVTAEVTLKAEHVEKILKSSTDNMVKYWRTSTLAVTQSGAIGAQGHVANGLTAMFIACGQDVACISESSIGITRMEKTENGDLYASLTLPSLIVGTVGGGTGLPTQRECLEILDCVGPGKANKLAEICCATALAGELSIAAALAEDHFTMAHENLGRK